MLKKYFLFFLILIVSFFAAFTKVFAQQAQQNNKGLSITPYSFTFNLKPGETKTDTISLTNFTNQALDIAVEARNFSANGEEGDVILSTQNNSYSLSSWIKIQPNRITIPPQSKLPFTFIISVPNNAEPGGHFGAIVFATVPKKNLTSTGAVLSQEVGSLLFVTTPGNIKENATIISFAPQKSFYEFGPVSFMLRMKNNSTIHIKPVGSIVITDMLNNTTTIPLESQNILPNAIRIMSSHLNKNILIGKYTARLVLSYGTKNQKLLATTTFTAFPIRYALIAIAILGFIIIINVLITLSVVKKSKKS